jgi:hypothetical protein
MSQQFPHITKLGLKIEPMGYLELDCVRAEHLEKLLAKAPRVTGFIEDGRYVFGSIPSDNDTLSALLFGFEPISRAVTADEVANMIQNFGSVVEYNPGKLSPRNIQHAVDLLKRILRDGYTPKAGGPECLK